MSKKRTKKYLSRIASGDSPEQREGPICICYESLLHRGKYQVCNNIPVELVLALNYTPGFFVGTATQLGDSYYVGIPQGADGNIMVIGGNGSGKSSGIAMPTLRTWQGAILATDIKGELSQCYKRLYQFGFVDRPYIVFDPMDEEGPSYDPFWWPIHDDAAQIIGNIWEIVLAIVPNQPDDSQPFWIEAERGVLAAGLLYYFNLGLSFSETICRIEMLPTSMLLSELVISGNPQVKIFLGETASMKDETLANIDRGLRNKLMLFAADPYITHALRGEREGATCFNWDDLENYNIFLRVPENRIKQWGGVINLMYSQLIHYLERRPDKYSAECASNIQTLLLMDEFARFGKLEAITSAMATLRSKNVNLCLIIQSMAQLDRIYGEHERRIILDNCQYQAILRANDTDTQKYLSDLIGTCIRRQHSVGEQLDLFMNTTGYVKNVSEIREPQVFPHELSTLEDVLLLTPYGFCRADKLKPDSDLAAQLRFDLTALHSRTGKLASIDEPIYFPPENSKRNEGAIMLNIQIRNENAAKRLTALQRQQRVKEKQERDAKAKKDRLRNYVIGEMVIQYFPELMAFEPGTEEENEVTFGPLKAFLIELAANQKLVKQIKRKTNCWDIEGEVFNDPGMNA